MFSEVVYCCLAIDRKFLGIVFGPPAFGVSVCGPFLKVMRLSYFTFLKVCLFSDRVLRCVLVEQLASASCLFGQGRGPHPLANISHNILKGFQVLFRAFIFLLGSELVPFFNI